MSMDNICGFSLIGNLNIPFNCESLTWKKWQWKLSTFPSFSYSDLPDSENFSDLEKEQWQPKIW